MPEIASLWPTDFGEVAVLTPVAVLRQQGAALGQQTQNIVYGRVQTVGDGQLFYQNFSLYCAPLTYETHLLQVTHGIDLYPAQVIVSGEPSPPLTAASPDELKERLKEVFAREKTKKTIASLIAQSKQ
jgi:hypothetical protein